MSAMSNYAKVCEQAVRDAGAVVQGWVGRTEVRKKGPTDLVTQADFDSQETIRQIVLGAFPNHSFLGEEDEEGVGCKQARDTEYRWIADPLDGTTNYVHHVPHYCVSLALERRGELLVAAVYDPNREECFTAASGEGALLNGRPMQTSNVAELSDALAAVGFPHDMQLDSPDLLVFLEAARHCQAIRRTGSTALNLCYLAAGRFDLYWSYSAKIWDVAAGILLVQEAGGSVTSPTGGKFTLEEPHFLAAAGSHLNSKLFDMATGATSPHFSPRGATACRKGKQ